MSILLGLDIGYTGCKAAAFDEEGKLLGLAYREYPMSHPAPGTAEMDPDLIWKRICEAIKEVTSILDGEVDAMSFSIMGEAFTPVDNKGRTVLPTFTAFDERGETECRELVEKLGRDFIFKTTGQVAGPSHPLPKICWIKKNMPDAYKSVGKFVTFGELVMMRLGLEPVIDYSMAARSMAFDLAQKKWSGKILDAAGIEADLLPCTAPAGTVVGTPDAKTASKLGLSKRTKIVVGGHDQPCGAVGAGVVRSGQASYALGTVHVICAVLDKFVPALGPAGFPCYPHVVGDRFVTMGYNFTGGSLLKWFRDTLGQTEQLKAEKTSQDAYDLLLSQMPEGPTDLFVMPHFSGTGTPWFDTKARGSILGLTLSVTKGQLVKAIIEGTAYELALNLILLKRAGATVNELHSIGGSAKSRADAQIRANIMGLAIHSMKVSEAAALGAAIIAGAGLGVYDSIEKTASGLGQVVSVIEPDEKEVEIYKKRLRAYEDMHPKIREIYRES